MMDLGSAFAASVRRQPDAVAVVDGTRRRTFAQWDAEIRAAAGALARMGLEAGDHFAVIMRNRSEMATLYWASHMLGLVFTPISWRGSLDEIAYCLEDCEAVAVAYDGAAGSAPAEAAERLGIDPRRQIVAADGNGDGVGFEQILEAAPVAGPAAPDDTATCLMLYTSGTTGRPKGVPKMLASALVNGKLVCMPDYSPAGVLRLVAAERVSSLFLVPTMFHDIVRDPAFGRHDLGSLSRVGYAGM